MPNETDRENPSGGPQYEQGETTKKRPNPFGEQESQGNEQTRRALDDRLIRRLPVVLPIDTRLTVAPTAGRGIFAAPQAVVPSATPIDSDQPRAAERDASDSIWR